MPTTSEVVTSVNVEIAVRANTSIVYRCEHDRKESLRLGGGNAQGIEPGEQRSIQWRQQLTPRRLWRGWRRHFLELALFRTFAGRGGARRGFLAFLRLV